MQKAHAYSVNTACNQPNECIIDDRSKVSIMVSTI